METDVACFIDPRTVSQGIRMLCTKLSFTANEIEVIQDPNRHYSIMRMINGILEGSDELGNQFPLNMNLEPLNGVSFNKGCYIG